MCSMSRWLGGVTDAMANGQIDHFMIKALEEKYPHNVLASLSVMERTGLLTGMEILMRAVQGQALERPIGSVLHLSPWEALLLCPTHLQRFPTPDTVKIDKSVIVGPLAEKPVRLDIPIMISGMAYGGALSKAAKVALAQAASDMGTATNTGESGLLPAEREAAKILIGQYNRGGYLNTPDKYKQLDAIEIQLGQGAQGPTPQRSKPKFMDDPEMMKVFDLEPGEGLAIHTRLPGVDSVKDFDELVARLREETGVPVGLKMGSSHHLERELEIAVSAGVDFLTLDGSEAGTHGSSPTAEDDLGLPSIFAVARARRFLEEHDLVGKVTLVASGGFWTPGRIIKGLALGADAINIGTAAVLSLTAMQIADTVPDEPPTQLILNSGTRTSDFDPKKGRKGVVNFLKVCVKEMQVVTYSMGHRAFRDIGRDDLVCTDPWLARALGVDYGGVAHWEQEAYYAGVHPGAGNHHDVRVEEEKRGWRRPSHGVGEGEPAARYTVRGRTSTGREDAREAIEAGRELLSESAGHSRQPRFRKPRPAGSFERRDKRGRPIQ